MLAIPRSRGGSAGRDIAPWPTPRGSSFCEAEWARAPGFAYLIERRADGVLVGSTGLAFETPWCAMTGYVLARDAWGQGYATEALAASSRSRRAWASSGCTRTATPTTPRRPMSSTRCGFTREGVLRRHTIFPNSGDPRPAAVLLYARTW